MVINGLFLVRFSNLNFNLEKTRHTAQYIERLSPTVRKESMFSDKTVLWMVGLCLQHKYITRSSVLDKVHSAIT